MSEPRVRTQAGISDPGVTAQADDVSRPAKRRLLVPILLQIAAMIGIGALVYSSAADWFATLGHNSEVSGYVDAVESLDPHERASMLQAARAYNSHMPQGVLRDPYASSTSADPASETSAYLAYERLLGVGDGNVLGSLSYPRLGIGLPIFHGTSGEVISRGVGHIYGSSLPTGDPGTHAALTAHSGLLHASLFTPLLDAEVGDTFHLNVLGETQYYEVTRLETVLPEHTESLRIDPGEELVTLITCTPIGVNSHRLLVTGERVPAPEGSREAIAGDGKSAGFPWWALIFLAGSGATGYLLFVPPRRKQPGAGGAA